MGGGEPSLHAAAPQSQPAFNPAFDPDNEGGLNRLSRERGDILPPSYEEIQKY